MQAIRIQRNSRVGDRMPLIAGALLMSAAVIGAGLFLLVQNGGFENYPYLFLLPWILGLAVVFCIPSAILINRKEFTLADPLVYGTWTYLFPAFVIGGVCLVAGWSDPYYLAFIQDARSTLPFTVVVVAVGYAGLTVGYFLPAGSWLGSRMSRSLPDVGMREADMLMPALVLFGLGIVNTTIAFLMGIGGYQNAEMSSYNGLIYLTTLFWVEGSFLLWSIIFRAGRRLPGRLLLVALLVITALIKAAFAGARGALLSAAITCGLAYVLSRGALKLREYFAAAAISAVILSIGMIYGSTFRSEKGGEEREGVARYATTISDTLETISRQDPQELVSYAMSKLTERIDILSSLAVVVSNYERLRPYEDAYGISNNIWSDMTTFFIPRILWPEKPTASDARSYGALYFDNGDTSPAVTPFGDLLRNFGLIGVPVGMAALGLVLRVLRTALLDRPAASLLNRTLYFMLLTSVSYEGFFGTIIPALFKDGIVTIVGLIIVYMLVVKLAGVRNKVAVA